MSSVSHKPSETWQAFLAELIQPLEAHRRLADAISVHPAELLWWIHGEGHEGQPRSRQIQALLQALSSDERTQSQMRTLLIRDGRLGKWQDYPTDCLDSSEVPPLCRQLIERTRKLQDAFMFPTIVHLVLRFAHLQLDPNRTGITIELIVCMLPTVEGASVRSLRAIQIDGSSPLWGGEPSHPRFLGAESLAGQVVMTGVPQILALKYGETSPQQWTGEETSFYACPLFQSESEYERIAGCLFACAKLPEFFLSPRRQHLLQQYASYCSMAFSADQFVPRYAIQLASLPLYQEQKLLLNLFTYQLRRRRLNDPQGSHQQAEHDPWCLLEQQLLSSLHERENST